MSLQGQEAHRALVRLLTGVPAHVDNQHVLGLEGLLLSGAGLPAAHELLLLPVDVLIVYMLGNRKTRQGGEVSKCLFPGAHSLFSWVFPCTESLLTHTPPPAHRGPPSHPNTSLPWDIRSTHLGEEHCSSCVSVCGGWGCVCIHARECARILLCVHSTYVDGGHQDNC